LQRVSQSVLRYSNTQGDVAEVRIYANNEVDRGGSHVTLIGLELKVGGRDTLNTTRKCRRPASIGRAVIDRQSISCIAAIIAG
jgi:hypothetical protein